MSESLYPTLEFTPAQAELVDAAWGFVRQAGSARIQCAEDSGWQGVVMYARAAQTPTGGELIVRINEASRSDLPYNPEQRSWDEHIHVELLNSAAGEYTSVYAIRRGTGVAFWYPDHTDSANDTLSHEDWRQSGGDIDE